MPSSFCSLWSLGSGPTILEDAAVSPQTQCNATDSLGCHQGSRQPPQGSTSATARSSTSRYRAFSTPVLPSCIARWASGAQGQRTPGSQHQATEEGCGVCIYVFALRLKLPARPVTILLCFVANRMKLTSHPIQLLKESFVEQEFCHFPELNTVNWPTRGTQFTSEGLVRRGLLCGGLEELWAIVLLPKRPGFILYVTQMNQILSIFRFPDLNLQNQVPVFKGKHLK